MAISKLTTTLLFLSIFTSAVSSTDSPLFDESISPSTLGLKQENLTHLHFYFHDIVSGKNPTAIQVAKSPNTVKSPTLFGFVAVMDDPLTLTPEPNSKRIGSAQGIYSSASQSETALLMNMNFVFSEGKYNGSTLSVLGRNAVFNEIREMPIVGGSGAFRFSRGYAQAKTVWFNLTTGDAVVEYNVYVLHY
ncbi:hypothetical protein ACFE04_001946 [Oxalis oulophora]